MDDLRSLIGEMVKELIQDDALFKTAENPGVLDKLDTPGDSNSSQGNYSKRSYMAKPQLYSIVKNAVDIYNMLEDDQEISDWMESHISQAEQMIDAVHGKLDYKNSPAYHGGNLGPVATLDD